MFAYGLLLFVYFFSIICFLINIKNILVSLLFIEIAYFSIACCFFVIALSVSVSNSLVYGLLVILIAAAESVIGLGLLITNFLVWRSVGYTRLVTLRV